MLQKLLRDSDELLLWMDEKFKVAEDESYRDPTNILRKLKRHEAAEREMKANQVRLDRLVQVSCPSLVPSPTTELKLGLQLPHFTELPHDVLVQLGQGMLAEEHDNSQSIRRKLSELSSCWRRLEDKMADRGDKLRQAGQQEQLMELLQVSFTPERMPQQLMFNLNLTLTAPPSGCQAED